MDKAMEKEKQIKRNCICGISLAAILLAGCAPIPSNENNSVYSDEEIQVVDENSSIGLDEEIQTMNEDSCIDLQTTQTMTKDDNISETAIQKGGESPHEEWYRTGVASYQWARIMISDYKEGESFQVTLDATYFPYSGTAEGTATFIDSDTAVLYDENVESFLQKREGDHGIYFRFFEDSIIVTHDVNVRAWFGGGGIATAEGTYIQGEPEYMNCTDVGEIFTEDELSQIQELLGGNYKVLFEDVIESGEIEEYAWDGGRLWKAYRPPYSAEWCDIIIYDDGRIYIEGSSYNSEANEFYTNSGDTEMPDVSS